MGMVGSGACVGSTKNKMAISLAGAIRVPAHHRRFSLHGFDVAALDRVSVNQIVSSNAKCHVDLADAVRRRARLGTFRSGMARHSRSGPRFRARIAAGVHTLAMDRAVAGSPRIYPSVLDGQLVRIRKPLSATHRNGIGLRAGRSSGAYCWMLMARAHARSATQMGADLARACARARDDANRGPVSVEFPMAAFFPFNSGDLCGGSTASLARDEPSRMLSRWPGSATPATTAIVLVLLTTIAMSVLRTAGLYAFPLTWIFLGLATLWCLLEFILRDSAFRGWTPAVITFWGAPYDISLHPAKLWCSEIQSLARVG